MGARRKRIYRATNPIVHWTCGACGQKFSRRYSLLVHVARIHGAPYTLLDLNTKVGMPDWDKKGKRMAQSDE
jgi:hypothetical protein